MSMLVLISNVEGMVHGMDVFLGHQSKGPNYLIQDTNYMVGRAREDGSIRFLRWEHLSIAHVHVVNMDLSRSDEFSQQRCIINK